MNRRVHPHKPMFREAESRQPTRDMSPGFPRPLGRMSMTAMRRIAPTQAGPMMAMVYNKVVTDTAMADRKRLWGHRSPSLRARVRR